MKASYHIEDRADKYFVINDLLEKNDKKCIIVKE